VTDDALGLIAADPLDVVVEATGDPAAGVAHALAAIEHGRHVVMVTVEGDVLALAERARSAGVVYSLAYGDQPALVCELVGWARACGFEVVCAGKGTNHLPAYHAVTPDAVWEHYGIAPDDAAAGGLNAKMFTSFLDGTKSAIEMAAICNATGLAPQAEGLRFPPCPADRLASVCIPEEDGGVLSGSRTVEVVSSLGRDGAPVPNDLRWGVYVVFEAGSDYVARCFAEYGLSTDPTGRYAALWRPNHLIGLEATVSILAAGLLGESTGTPDGFRGDVAAVAKRDLAAGEVLDGEGGSTVWGRLVTAPGSPAASALPVGLSRGAMLRRPVATGETVRLADIDPLLDCAALSLRRELESPRRASVK
jgi:predicted homoserine dehydrogenase-like protein